MPLCDLSCAHQKSNNSMTDNATVEAETMSPISFPIKHGNMPRLVDTDSLGSLALPLEADQASVEETVDSTPSNSTSVLRNLKLEMSPVKPLGELDVHIVAKNDEEFALSPRRFTGDFIDDERLLTTPEKLVGYGIDVDSGESISKRTPSSEGSHDAHDMHMLSPTSQKVSHYAQAHSKIPLPTRRSKRLEVVDVDLSRTRCVPRQISVTLRPVLKPQSRSLNLIVDSASGRLHEATRYATEINSLNGEGVEIPRTTAELVQVPIIGSRKSSKKVALVRGYQVKSRLKSGHTVGFYSDADYQRYCESPSKVVKTHSPKKKEVRWASELEW